MNETPVLEACDVTKVFQTPAQTLEILRGINLVMHAGETMALLGVSGSGKSTLLHILGSLDTPTTGEVRILGKPVQTLGSAQRDALRNRHIGFVYQTHCLLPEFSVLENVMMPLLIRREKPALAREQSRLYLEEVGLGARLQHKPGQLSGGERQRVAIARALVTHPDLVLADEPTGNLDPKTAASVFETILNLNRKYRLAFLMVTHNHELAMSLDRQIQLLDGAILELTPAKHREEGL
ncbi:MAG: ABC transporter ATP-binding protein [Magnetococcales bacterium]|nr:ABC transporter ATP-binding protein [Magnetococcales bacterium]